MSNVLIGVIGVILFIGLAIAGASFLGDRFRSASATTQAAAAVAQISQVQSAIAMWRLKTGQDRVSTQDTAFLVPRFLKSRAVNPTPFGRANPARYSASVHVNNDLDLNQDDEGRASIGAWVMMEIGTNQDARARDVCIDVQRRNGVSSIPNERYPVRPSGCSDWNGSYVLYGRI